MASMAVFPDRKCSPSSIPQKQLKGVLVLMRKLVWLCGLLALISISAVAQDYPKVEVFGGYSYLHTSVVGNGFNFNGGSGSVAYNPNQWFGIVGDFGAYHNGAFGVSTTDVTYLFGPKFTYRK